MATSLMGKGRPPNKRLNPTEIAEDEINANAQEISHSKPPALSAEFTDSTGRVSRGPLGGATIGDIVNLVEIIPAIVSVAALIFLMVKGASLKTYLEEKGKLLATKEQLEEMTRKVEEVKADVRKTIEHELEVKQQERMALWEYFNNCHRLLIEKLPEIHEVPNDFNFYSPYEISIKKYLTEIMIGYHRLLVHFRFDHPIIVAAKVCMEATQSWYTVLRKHEGKLAVSHASMLSAAKERVPILENPHLESFGKAIEDYLSDEKPIRDILTQAIGAYRIELRDYFSMSGK